MRTGKKPDDAGEDWDLEEREVDPPLAAQLLPYVGSPPSDRFDAFMRLCQAAPSASSGTKRKWKRRLGL